MKFEGEIYDEEVAEKIRAGLISHVSIAADYELVEPVNGRLPRGLRFRELSLVAVPGIPEANLQPVEKLLEKLASDFHAHQVEKLPGGEAMSNQGEGKNLEANFNLEDLKAELQKIAEGQKVLRETLTKIFEASRPAEGEGKGLVEDGDEEKGKLLERLKAGSLREQWHTPISVTEHELAAHLRQYVNVTDLVAGKAGDTVNIPYVKDFDLSLIHI